MLRKDRIVIILIIFIADLLFELCLYNKFFIRFNCFYNKLILSIYLIKKSHIVILSLFIIVIINLFISLAFL